MAAHPRPEHHHFKITVEEAKTGNSRVRYTPLRLQVGAWGGPWAFRSPRPTNKPAPRAVVGLTRISRTMIRSSKAPRWPYSPPAARERAAQLQAEVQRIINERQTSVTAVALGDGTGTWREVLAADALTSPQRVTPRFRCRTPRDGGPLYVDKPMPVPLPAGRSHVNFQQASFRGDVREAAERPPNPRRLPSALPSPREEPGPNWEVKRVEHVFSWRH